MAWKAGKLTFAGAWLAFLLAMAGMPALAGGLTLAHGYQDESPVGQWARNFAQCADSAVGIPVEIYPAGMVGRSHQLSEPLLSGQIDMAIIPATALQRFFPELQALSAPGLVENPMALAEVSSDPSLVRSIEKQLEGKQPMRLLGIGWSPGVLVGNESIADLKGAKIRSFGLASGVLSQLGAIQMRMPLAEVFYAIQYGVTDGAVVGIDTADTLVSERVVTSLVLAADFSPFASSLLLVMNGNSADVFGYKVPQVLLDECAKVTYEFNIRQADRVSALVTKARKEGVSVFGPDDLDRDRWRKAFEIAWEETGRRGDGIRSTFQQMAPRF